MNSLSGMVELLSGGDLRSIGKSSLMVAKVHNQSDFDNLFQCLSHKNRIVVMRAADAIEKITVEKPQYLAKHKKKILDLCNTASNKELKWHLATIITRLEFSDVETNQIWRLLKKWSFDKNESRIVRVNSLQGLFDLTKKSETPGEDFNAIMEDLERERIPSLNARIKKIKKVAAKS